MVYLVTSHPAGGARVYEALLDEQEGVLDFRSYDTGRARARKFLRDVAQRRQAAMLKIDVAAARGLIARAEANHPAKRPLPRGFVESRAQLRLDAAGATPGEEVVEALGSASEDRDAALERLGERIRAGELGPWPPPAEALEGVAERLQEQSSGELVVSDATRRERLQDVLGETVGEIYDERLCAATVRRFREEAFLAWRAEKEDEARDCLAGAEAFESRSGELPLAIAFLEVTLGPLLEQLGTNSAEEDSSSLLVKP